MCDGDSTLRVDSNMLTGTIPDGYSALINLQYAYFSDNQLTGVVPARLASIVSSSFDFNCLNNCSYVRQPSCSCANTNAKTAINDTAALLELYLSTRGGSWFANYGWSSFRSGSDPCADKWYGVSCSGSSPARVTYVDVVFVAAAVVVMSACGASVAEGRDHDHAVLLHEQRAPAGLQQSEWVAAELA